MPVPYPSLIAPAVNGRGKAADYLQMVAAAIAQPRGLVSAPVSRTTQSLGCTETYLSPLFITFTIPAAYGTRLVLCTVTAQVTIAVGDQGQFWLNGVVGASLPALGGTARQKAMNIPATVAGGQSSGYGVMRFWATLPPAQYTFSVSGLSFGPNCATGGPFANGTTDKLWFAMEDKGPQ